jgi:hypothetical protein
MDHVARSLPAHPKIGGNWQFATARKSLGQYFKICICDKAMTKLFQFDVTPVMRRIVLRLL